MSTVIIAVAALIETDFLCFWNPKVYCFISTAKRCSYKSPKQRFPSHPYPSRPLIALKQERPMIWYIFENEIIQGPQKQCSQMSDTQIHKYKYTTTQYTHTVLVKLSDRPKRWYNFEKVMVRRLQKQCSQVQSGTIR